jgi:ligand-binding SRPBCC domain-containing protein
MSKLYSVTALQRIPADLDTMWNFISSPLNLQKITPAYMRFKILTDVQGKMYPGQIIAYHIKPVAGIRLSWVTEITHVEDKAYFVDEQRFGPYSFWHHKHFLKPIPGGVEMTDIVHYKIPFGFLGDIANSLFVGKQLRSIFDYRYKAMEELFGTWK